MKPKPLNKVVSRLLGYWLLGPIFFCFMTIIGVSIYFSVKFIQQRPANHQLYIAILTLILLHISVITICVLTVKKLQGWFRQYIIQPIAQLNQGTEALIANNFQQSQATLDAPIKVSEINTLRTSIQYLSQTLQARQEALRESQERIQWRNKQLEILHKVGLEIVTELDLDARLKAIVTQAIEITNGASGGLYLYHSESNILEWMTGAGGGNPPKGSILHKGEGLSGKVWETNTPLIINDYDNWEGRIKNYTIPGYHPCVVGVPLHWETQFLGVLVVTGNAPNTFTQETVDVLQLFTSQAASAINNAQLFAQVQTEREHISILYQASQLLSNATSMKEVATAALEIAPLLKAEDGSLILLDFYGQPLFYSTAEKHNELSFKQIKEFLTQITTAGLESWILENREPALITDIENDPRWLLIPEFEPRPIHAAICAPLVNYRNEIFGFLLYSHSQP
ncbi:MAG: GAF domain-containing protein, partial [Anaerolineae bacterium]|nr:GAF domain-containing protein [Anaerolineae bacterium]